jgi:hypothetical protein
MPARQLRCAPDRHRRPMMPSTGPRCKPVRPMAPTRPPAPVTRMGLTIFVPPLFVVVQTYRFSALCRQMAISSSSNNQSCAQTSKQTPGGRIFA